MFDFEIIILKMHENCLEQIEEELMITLERLDKKLNQIDASIGFEQFQNIEKMFDDEFNVFFPKYRQRYQELAIKYLQNVIKNSQLSFKQQSTSIVTAYFMKEEMKIKDTSYYPFHKSLINLNFFNFVNKLHIDVKLNTKNNSQSAQTHLMARNQNLIKANNFCDTQCIGCNGFFYQFHPIDLNSCKKTYETVFLSNNRNLKSQNALQPTTNQEIEYSCDIKIDLFNLQDKESQHSLLREITNILNKKGGFIVIGCKRVQQFRKIKRQHHYKQLCQNYMNVHFVIGESLNEQHKSNIRIGLTQLVTKITPSVEIGNIDISFIPIKQSPYELGYDIQSLIINTDIFQRQKLHLVLIKIHPTQQKYYVEQATSVFYEQSVQEPDFDFYDEREKQLRKIQFLSLIQQGMTQQEKKDERIGINSQRSYFNGHKCDPLPYRI